MAHEIEVVNGQASMFFVGETPWHGLGTPLVDPPSVSEAIKLAGLDWQVKMQPLYLGDGRQVTHSATVRSSDNSILGIVGQDYTVLQNEKAFQFFQPFIDQKLVSLETAGSLRNGSRIWILAKIKADPIEVIPGDQIQSYILLYNSHDGTLACGTGFTRIRTVCANTLATAMKDSASKLMKIKHTQHIETALDMVRNAMQVAQREFTMSVEQYRTLASKGCNAKDLEKYVKLVFSIAKPKSVIEIEDNTEENTSGKRLLPKITALFETGKGTEIKGVRGTMWGAYNAVTEYLGYQRGTDQANRVDNLWFGQGVNVNKKALETALSF